MTQILTGKFRICRLNFRVLVYFLSIYILVCTKDAYAMHISEGILPFRWAALWYAVSAPFIFYGLRRLKEQSKVDPSFKPLVGLMAAVVFVISCMPIPVPTAGTCSHPGGTAISGILVGPSISILVAAVALMIQALFLAHGGLSTLGANILSMGILGSITGYVIFKVLRRCRVSLAVSAFCAGVLSDWAIYVTTSMELASGIRGESAFFPLFTKICIAFIPTQLPLGILEGFMTAGAVSLLVKRRSDLMVRLGIIKAEGEGAR